MEYKPILTIAESEKATVEMASMKGHRGPVVVKRLKEANPDIYRLLCHVQNSHIPQIYEVEEQGTDILVAEEHIDGGNLEEYLEKRVLSDEEKLELALQLCEAVEFLHGMEPPIIHRDIKPSNILITGKGVLKLIDFDASRNYKENGSGGDTRLLGTVEYAPPEQFGYSQTDIRSDIYSMGVVFHEIPLTENEKRAKEWARLVEKCTSFDPQNRFQNVAELKKEIEKLIAWKKKQKKKLAIRISLLLLVILAVSVSVPVIRKAIETNTAQKEEQSGEENPEQNQESGLKEHTGDFYYEYPQNVTATLNSSATGRINALYFRFADQAGYAELERLQAWCYEISQDGKSILVKKEYLREIRTDIGQLNLVVACDDGSLYELTVHILAGIPEGATLPVAEEETSVIIPESTEELYPNLEQVPRTIWYSYYQSARTEFVIPDDKYREYELFEYATCYCYQTGLTVDIPADMLQLEDGYVIVSQQFMMSLEPYIYEFCFYYAGPSGEKTVVEKTFKVYPEETQVLSTGSLLLKSEQTVYTDMPGRVTNMVRNGKHNKISKVYVQNQTRAEENLWGTGLSGRTLWVSGSKFIQYLDQETVTLYIEFDTGELCEMTIHLVEGLPEVVRPKKGNLEEVAADLDKYLRYYKAVSVKPAVIYTHYQENLQLERVLCYNYVTEERWEIPAEMIESGAGYFSVSGEYVHTLEEMIYRITFVTSTAEMSLNVRIFPEAWFPEAVQMEDCFFDTPVLGNIGVPVVLRFEVPYRISGVSIVRDGEEVPVDPEWYHIACDGRYALVKREFFTQYQGEASILLVYRFDNGTKRQVDISLVN